MVRLARERLSLALVTVWVGGVPSSCSFLSFHRHARKSQKVMDAAGAAVGIASLGIQVCEDLVRYYNNWKECGQDIAETARCVESLGGIFKVLKALLEGQQLLGPGRIRVGGPQRVR